MKDEFGGGEVHLVDPSTAGKGGKWKLGNWGKLFSYLLASRASCLFGTRYDSTPGNDGVQSVA